MLRKAVFPRSHLADYSDDLSIFTNTRVSARPKFSAIFLAETETKAATRFLGRNRTFGRTLILTNILWGKVFLMFEDSLPDGLSIKFSRELFLFIVFENVWNVKKGTYFCLCIWVNRIPTTTQDRKVLESSFWLQNICIFDTKNRFWVL